MRYPELDMLIIGGFILYAVIGLIIAVLSGEFKKSEPIEGAEEFEQLLKKWEEEENEQK